MQPNLILTPFGENATAGTIDSIPETRGPSDPPQKATWNDGFPGVTMTPLAAGGVPPRGQDFNGVLKAISEHTVFVGGGGQYKWSSEFAALDGYPLGALVQKIGNDGFWLNTVDGNTTNPDSGGAGWVDSLSTTLPYAADSGSANAYAATYTPAPSALRSGMVLRFKASNSNTGASTFNPNGLGAKPIVTIGGLPLSSGAIVSGNHVWVQYDATIGGGSWVSLLSASTDLLSSPVVTLAASASINLTSGAPNSANLIISGTGVTINGFTVASGRTFIVRFSGANTLVNSASLITNTGTNIVTADGDSCIIRAISANTVEVLMFSKGADGAFVHGLIGYRVSYDKAGNRIIEQWGNQNFTTSGANITFPIPFPTACDSVICSMGPTVISGVAATKVNDITATGFVGYIASGLSSGSIGCSWRARGH